MHVLICLVKWLRAAWIKNITIKKLRYCCDHISIICHRCGPAQGRFLQELGIARGLGVFPNFFPCPNVAPMFSQNVYVRLLKISGASGRIKNQSEENMCCPYLSLPQWLSQDMYVLLFKISGVSRRN